MLYVIYLGVLVYLDIAHDVSVYLLLVAGLCAVILQQQALWCQQRRQEVGVIMAKYLNADSPRKVVVEAAMQGADHIRAEHLRSCAETDADFYVGLRAAQDYGMEVRGYSRTISGWLS